MLGRHRRSSPLHEELHLGFNKATLQITIHPLATHKKW
ncbi:hypothetical protein SynBIOSE41_01014 [Synechococcus sp. BIOS-E4-1]|nr:hypothetical protein SynBIOSE41_01014 [Synechococcus sp. BIOS-E4-1]